MATTAFLDKLHAQALIYTDGSVPFAKAAMASRIPKLLHEIADQNAATKSLSETHCAKLRAFADDVAANKPIPALSNPAIDPTWHADYERLGAGKTWHDAAWFFAEAYLFRLVLDVTGYDEHGVDPFHCQKMHELDDATPWRLLETAAALDASDLPTREKLGDLMKLSLWGNKADGAYKEVKDTISGAHANLAVDDQYLLTNHCAQVIEHLESFHGSTTVHFINDNCGTEILLDLALVDHLLTHKWCTSIVLHVKGAPTYVSDATANDIVETVRLMGDASRTPSVRALASRLQAFLDQGVLKPIGDLFWNQYRFYFELPAHVTHSLGSAGLVVLKGDANYRRLLGDRLWPATTPIAEAVPYFPAPFVALRTMKSDPIVGILPAQETTLEADDPLWRINGQRGVIQSVLR
ncbi:hypothetical protein SPRG_04469 [Saprolegnia parasitica CBS 223.65]|uniref:Sugar phosphate phosphatase n=1 Tax=Saprolegnia parasitica (strain CBS 223.65) TaxID=695850 RepID=A0A067CJ63_SAPPC|nr:hypothetical protein SPRG_04469 [Saprolegnia parasitica CBS 223.65]KDO30568.1 hypothetical protein SPRG_04469 [Saprolegnia parasitica CBS 223.65]|eukprot:XP_012198783.1 hypothetical protein SPRG_04469 [Saprolegnia parasitica CBS 223.65]